MVFFKYFFSLREHKKTCSKKCANQNLELVIHIHFEYIKNIDNTIFEWFFLNTFSLQEQKKLLQKNQKAGKQRNTPIHTRFLRKVTLDLSYRNTSYEF